MKSKIYVALIAAVVSTGFTSCDNNDEPNSGESVGGYKLIEVVTTGRFEPTNAETAANAAAKEFGYRFFNATAVVKGVENLSVSPLSASLAISMVANSVDDQFASEIAKFIGIDNLNDLNSLNTKTIAYLTNKRDNECIELANSVWYADRYKIKPEYEADMNSKYFAEINCIKFTDKKAPTIIDGWVSAKTHGIIPKISDVVPFSNDLETLFINTLYFTGKWHEAFDSKDTTRETFYGLKNSSTVDMMHNKSLRAYASTEEGELVTCNFQGGTTMAIFMPAKESNFEEVCKNFTLYKMKQIQNACEPARVTLSLPKFTKNFEMRDLDLVFGKMGLGKLSGQLEKMGINNNVYLKGIQKTSIDVDEDGVTLAAVTAIETFGSAWDPNEYKDVSITINRPFIYVISDSMTGATLLMGTVTDF